MNTKEKKDSSFLNKLFTGVSLVYLLLGILLILIPDLQMEYVCYGISIVLVILGIVFIVKYFLTESYKNLNQYGFSIGVFFVIIGICMLLKNEQMAKSFQFYIGVCILLTAIVKLQNAMDLKALKDRAWSVIFVVSIVIMACAMLIIINPFSDRNYEVALTYFSLLFDGVISLFSYNYLAFRIKKNEKKRARKLAEASREEEKENEPQPVPVQADETQIEPGQENNDV
ncbi:MAG: DUF308 domain-containing protein [Lachnospiraceae bacterium]